MLPKKNRLKKQEVDLVFKKGKPANATHFFLKVYQKKENERSRCKMRTAVSTLSLPSRNTTSHDSETRYCIAFAKAISIKGAERIALRRRIYNAIEKNRELWIPQTDIALIIKPSILKLPRKKIEPTIKEALQRLKKLYG